MIPAKSDKAITLLRHTADVAAAADALFGIQEPTRLACQWLRFFRLPTEAFPLFQAELTAAALLHDIGKANQGFVDAVGRVGEQNIRHEHLSALIINLPEMAAWLRTSSLPIDWDITLAAVLGHHLKASADEFAKDPANGEWIRVLSDDGEFAKLLDTIAARLLLTGKVPTIPMKWHFYGKDGALNVDTTRKTTKRRLRDFDEKLEDDETRLLRRRLWAVRAALIAADAVGSAMERTRTEIAEWVRSIFDREPLSELDIRRDVIDKRIEQLRGLGRWKDTNGRKGWTEFQDHAAEPQRMPSRTLLLAPCGAGKTLAAWRWIAARLLERRAARVLFLYPTRATATEGFRDYVSWAPEAAALMHGTAAYELTDLHKNPKDPRYGRRYETEERLFALGFWTKRIFSATVDQFLAFLQYGYGPVCMLPVLADSVVVIDEVHSFDPGMFSALCEFLREFDAPVLCMTATLPKNRIEELTRCGLKVYNEKPDDLTVVAGRPRYWVRHVNRVESERCVHKALGEGKRVLWVVNKVARAQEIAESFASGSVPVYCYHSRFTLDDRKNRHAAAVAAVRPDQPASLTVTTQVCEMSLDLDADVLVTEVAPITSLIQRMGRCNRDRDTRFGAGEVLIYQPEDDKPYETATLAGVPEFLRTVTAKECIGQSDLEVALAAAPRSVELPKACQFTESGPYADGREDTLRDIDEFSVRAVLDRDVPEFLRLCRDRKPTDGLIVPVPKRFGRDPPAGLPKWLRVAPSSHYDPLFGFRDQPIQSGGAT